MDNQEVDFDIDNGMICELPLLDCGLTLMLMIAKPQENF